MNLPHNLRRLRNAINDRPTRERRLLALTLVVLLGALWYGLFQGPRLQQVADTAGRTVDLQRDAGTERATFTELQRLLDADPRAAAREQDRRNKAELARLDAELVDRALKIITPAQMVQALRDVLDRQRGLQLESLENLPVEPAFRAVAADTAEAVPTVFRHRVRIALSGDYLAVLRYLDALETLPWRFQWDSFVIETDRYPVAGVVMYLSTLSLGETWIGT